MSRRRLVHIDIYSDGEKRMLYAPDLTDDELPVVRKALDELHSIWPRNIKPSTEPPKGEDASVGKCDKCGGFLPMDKPPTESPIEHHPRKMHGWVPPREERCGSCGRIPGRLFPSALFRDECPDCQPKGPADDESSEKEE